MSVHRVLGCLVAAALLGAPAAWADRAAPFASPRAPAGGWGGAPGGWHPPYGRPGWYRTGEAAAAATMGAEIGLDALDGANAAPPPAAPYTPLVPIPCDEMTAGTPPPGYVRDPGCN